MDQLHGVIQKAKRRILPLILACYVVAFVDRTNIGVAALRMNDELGLTMAAFGVASGIFFVGYALFEVPSNLILHRVGARLWIARIMITWGIVASVTAYVSGPISLYVLRFALGVAEAGFFPGIILYFTYWFPRRERARVVAMMMTGIPVSFVLANPISGWLVEHAGWRMMFMVEGIPAILLGLVVLAVLPRGPADASWLTPAERDLLLAELRAEEAEQVRATGVRRSLTDPVVLGLAVAASGVVYATYMLNFYLPSAIADLMPGLTATGIGWVSTVPYAAATLAMVVWARISDLSGERVRHLAATILVGTAGYVLAFQSASPVLAVVALTVAAVGILASGPIFWTIPTHFLGGAGAAAAIGLINGVAHVSVIVGLYAMGALRDSTGGYAAGFLVAAGYLVVSAGIVLISRPGAVVTERRSA